MKYLVSLILFMGLSLSAMAEIKILEDGDVLLRGENAVVTIKNLNARGWHNKVVLVEALEDFTMEGEKVGYGHFFKGGILKLLRKATKMMNPSQLLPWDVPSPNMVVRPSDGAIVKHSRFRPADEDSRFYIMGEEITSESQWLSLGGKPNVFQPIWKILSSGQLIVLTNHDYASIDANPDTMIHFQTNGNYYDEDGNRVSIVGPTTYGGFYSNARLNGCYTEMHYNFYTQSIISLSISYTLNSNSPLNTEAVSISTHAGDITDTTVIKDYKELFTNCGFSADGWLFNDDGTVNEDKARYQLYLYHTILENQE